VPLALKVFKVLLEPQALKAFKVLLVSRVLSVLRDHSIHGAEKQPTTLLLTVIELSLIRQAVHSL
jgi:hypothetical protein